jgi:RNA polymerase sigma-70 factor (ECF subfamily)
VAAIDAQRWAELYRLEFPRVYRAVLAVLRDPDRALDTLHDAFLEGLKRPPAHDDNLAGWLYVVALRKARRGALVRAATGSVRLASPATDEIERLLDRMHVGALLADLTERQRAVVVAQYYLGLDHREIAQRLGIQRGTVSATLFEATGLVSLSALMCPNTPTLGSCE